MRRGLLIMIWDGSIAMAFYTGSFKGALWHCNETDTPSSLSRLILMH